MKTLYYWKTAEKIILCSLISAGFYFVFSIGITQAQDMPTFRQGMWEFNRMIENPNDPGKPQTMVTHRCANPTDDMKKRNEMLSKIGCKVSPLSKSGKTYSFTAECKVQNITVQSKSVMTVVNDTAYSLEVESRSEAKNTKEVLRARRTGDCEK